MMEPADGRLARRRVSAWKGVRGNFQDFLGDQIKCRGTLASLEGPGKEQIKEAAQERLLENVISSINKDTPEGRHMYQRWTRAQASHHQVCDALRSKNFRRDLSDYAGGTKATRDAVKVVFFLGQVFFPEDWCRLLSEDEILAELVVDCATSSIVDSLLDASIELLESHEGWYWPTQHPFRRLQSTPELRVWGSSSPVASWVNQSVTQSPKSFREQVSQPELPPRWRQPVDRSRGSRDLSLSSLSRDLDASAKGKTLKHFRSAKPFNPFMTRLYSFTDSQRPQRRLQREPRDPFAPKWSFPMMAHHFPEQWNRMVPPSTPKCVTTPVASKATGLARDARDDVDREEEAPPGYTWLQRKTRDGQTVFPYSLASHRAFFESYKDPELRAKAEAVVPLRMTDWPPIGDI